MILDILLPVLETVDLPSLKQQFLQCLFTNRHGLNAARTLCCREFTPPNRLRRKFDSVIGSYLPVPRGVDPLRNSSCLPRFSFLVLLQSRLNVSLAFVSALYPKRRKPRGCEN